MRAYDIDISPRPADRTAPDNHGWCYGLPPGLAPAQWPLDPNNGYPLMHGFTLLLPDDYRCHGPAIVALSFFGTACDMSDGGPAISESIAAAFEPGAPEPADARLAAFWRAERNRHPRLSRMRDMLDGAFAAILLTAEEFGSELCPPPTPLPRPSHDPIDAPGWIEWGSAFMHWRLSLGSEPIDRPEDKWLSRFFGGRPECELGYNRAITWRPRGHDPNAGVPTCDVHDRDQTGYEGKYCWDVVDGRIENFRLKDWANGHAPHYIGGTMQTCQKVPRFSPFHLGFDEDFGGWNFGGGRAQLDFKDMRFDWACG